MESLTVTPDVIKTLVDKDAQLMTGLSNTLKNSMKNEKSLHKLREGLGKEFDSFSSWETNKTISGLYKEVGDTYKNIATSHLAYVRVHSFK